MNAPIPKNATSQANQPASSERGIDRLFAEMAASYGSKLADLWAGADIEHVKAKWVEKLKPFAAYPGVIQSAINALDHHPNPPTLPVFLGLCRDAMRHIEEPTPALPHKLTAEDHQRAVEAAEGIKRVLKRKVEDGIDKHWATHPRCHEQLKAIFEAAANDARFRPCIDQMIADGICTPEGKLLKVYNGGRFIDAGRYAA